MRDFTPDEMEFFNLWYREQGLSNKVIKSTYVNGEGVRVWGKVLLYPATIEQWIRDGVRLEIPDNYRKPI